MANGIEYWSVQLVKYGQSAIAPSEPEVAGKTFKGWDKDYMSFCGWSDSLDNIKSDKIVFALFKTK